MMLYIFCEYRKGVYFGCVLIQPTPTKLSQKVKD